MNHLSLFFVESSFILSSSPLSFPLLDVYSGAAGDLFIPELLLRTLFIKHGWLRNFI